MTLFPAEPRLTVELLLITFIQETISSCLDRLRVSWNSLPCLVQMGCWGFRTSKLQNSAGKDLKDGLSFEFDVMGEADVLFYQKSLDIMTEIIPD